MSILMKIIKESISGTHYQVFKRGDVIYREGDDSKYVWFIEAGLVGLFHIAESGRETFLRVFGEGYLSGHRSAVVNEIYHASAVALTTSRIGYLPKDDFLRLLKSSPEALLELTQILARDLRQAEERIAGLMDKSAAKRVIETILYLQLRYPTQPWTRKEIAELSETTLETTTRVMTQLEDENFITKEGRRFSINDPQGLLRHSHQL
jgi:CRP-like cAMP-binding protein